MTRLVRQRRQYQERKARGICVHTGCSNMPAPNRVRCGDCADYIKFLQRNHHQYRPLCTVPAQPPTRRAERRDLPRTP